MNKNEVKDKSSKLRFYLYEEVLAISLTQNEEQNNGMWEDVEQWSIDITLRDEDWD